MKEVKKTSRASEERSKDKRNQPWTPPNSLDAPPAPKGFVQRWIRVESMGFMDSANVSKRLREGWVFLRSDTLKSEIGENEYPKIHEGKYAGLIGVPWNRAPTSTGLLSLAAMSSWSARTMSTTLGGMI